MEREVAVNSFMNLRVPSFFFCNLCVLFYIYFFIDIFDQQFLIIFLPVRNKKILLYKYIL